MAGLALVVELLAQARRDLGVNLAGVDGPVVAGIDGEDQLELADVGRHRRGHVRVLQLARQRRAVVSDSTVHLAEGGCGCGLALEIGEGRAPVGAELGGHAPLDEAPAHRRRPRLEGAECLGIFVGQAARDRREQLRDLHQRSLEAAERAPELGRVPLPVGGQTEIALARHAGGDAADRGADTRIAAYAPAQPVVLPFRHDRPLGIPFARPDPLPNPIRSGSPRENTRAPSRLAVSVLLLFPSIAGRSLRSIARPRARGRTTRSRAPGRFAPRLLIPQAPGARVARAAVDAAVAVV